MSNDNVLLKPIARCLRDLLVYDENLIRFGRDNYAPESYTDGVLILDYLTALPLDAIKSYDSDTEIETITTKYELTTLLDAYGDAGATQAYKFINKVRSENSRQLQKLYGINVFVPSGIQNLRTILGKQQLPRVEVAFTSWVTVSDTESVLRIDEIQYDPTLTD